MRIRQELGPEIDKSKYEHLDTATREEFIAEFLARNDKFMKDYRELAEVRPWDERLAFVKNYGVYPGFRKEVALKLRRDVREGETEKPVIHVPLLTAIRVTSAGSIAEEPWVPDDKNSQGPGYIAVESMAGISTKRSGEERYSTSDWLLHQLWGFPNAEGDYTCDDCMIFKVNVKYPAKAIARKISKILSHYQGKQKRFKKKEWKYYLICYDLKKADTRITYAVMADSLGNAYPNEKEGLFDEKNCENYYKKASFPINEGYRDYL